MKKEAQLKANFDDIESSIEELDDALVEREEALFGNARWYS